MKRYVLRDINGKIFGKFIYNGQAKEAINKYFKVFARKNMTINFE